MLNVGTVLPGSWIYPQSVDLWSTKLSVPQLKSLISPVTVTLTIDKNFQLK